MAFGEDGLPSPQPSVGHLVVMLQRGSTELSSGCSGLGGVWLHSTSVCELCVWAHQKFCGHSAGHSGALICLTLSSVGGRRAPGGTWRGARCIRCTAESAQEGICAVHILQSGNCSESRTMGGFGAFLKVASKLQLGTRGAAFGQVGPQHSALQFFCERC